MSGIWKNLRCITYESDKKTGDRKQNQFSFAQSFSLRKSNPFPTAGTGPIIKY